MQLVFLLVAMNNGLLQRVILASLFVAITHLVIGNPVLADKQHHGHTHKNKPKLTKKEKELAMENLSEDLTEAERALVKKALDEGEVVIVYGERPYIPVAARSVRNRDLKLRPTPRPADILRVVPGVFVNQHAGGGKANQYFLRGFDADHGTDIALSFDGIPINMVSHGHGQGYADLNWVIPELVQSVDTFKGTYSPRLGDFATAGSINFRPYDEIEKSSIAITGGRFSFYRALGILSGGQLLGWKPLTALEVAHSDGAFDNPENNQRYSFYNHMRRDIGKSSTFKLGVTSYRATWNGSGQIPLREVSSGQLSRFGSLDPSEGGVSERHSAYARLHTHPSDNSDLSVLLYLVRYKFNLFSNFTFFSTNTVDGDQIEQEDNRWMGGLSLEYKLKKDIGEIESFTTAGLQMRGDAIDTGLFDTVQRQRGMSRVNAYTLQSSAALFIQEDTPWTPWLRTVLGVRADVFNFDVDDRLQTSSANRSATLVSPKASLVVSPSKETDLFLNIGYGFHSNDARAVVNSTDPGTPLARAKGYELGLRTELLERFDLAGALWLLDLENETVWVGDEGVTEARGQTRRFGVELEARWSILDWLVADTDVTLSNARFSDLPEDENFIPLAPRFTVTSGISMKHPNGFFGRLGGRALSDRPLTEDNFLVADGFVLLDATIGYRKDRFELLLALDNVFNTNWKEAQFATTSRLATDPSSNAPPPPNTCPSNTRVETTDTGDFSGCEDVHFTPGSPFNAMLTARLFF